MGGVHDGIWESEGGVDTYFDFVFLKIFGEVVDYFGGFGDCAETEDCAVAEETEIAVVGYYVDGVVPGKVVG